MKHLIFILILSLSLINLAYAKWAPLNLKQLIKYSDTIVLAKYISEIENTKSLHGKSQTVEFEIIEIYSGSQIKKAQVFGTSTKACKAQYYFTNKKGDQFLLFLRKSKDKKFNVVNGIYGALPIVKNKLNWFVNNKKYSSERKPILFTEAIVELKKMLTKQ